QKSGNYCPESVHLRSNHQIHTRQKPCKITTNVNR
ncbi:hypothetical protein SD15574_3601, partial [Shigella dysenteriae 155-74]